MPFWKHLTSRRREVRRNIGRQGAPWYSWLLRRDVLWGVFYALLFITVVSPLVRNTRRMPPYQAGQLVDRAVVARVDVQHVNEALTQEKKQLARNKVEPIYLPNEAFLEEAQTMLERLPATVAKADTPEDVADPLRRVLAIDQAVLDALKQYQKEGEVLTAWGDKIDRFMIRIMQRPILESEVFQLENSRLPMWIELRWPDGEKEIIAKRDILDRADDDQIKRHVYQQTDGLPTPIQGSLTHYFAEGTDQATCLHDDTTTQELKDAAAEKVKPELVIRHANEVLIRPGTRIAADDLALLKKEQAAYDATLTRTQLILNRISQFGLVVLITVGLIGWVVTMQPRIVRNPLRGLALTLLLLATTGFAYAVMQMGPIIGTSAPIAPTLLTAMIVAIAYDRRFALGIAVLHGLLVGLALHLSVAMLLVVLATSVVALSQLREVRHRVILFRVGAIAGAVGAAGVLVAGLCERQMVPGMFSVILREAGLGMAGALAVGAIVLFVLPAIEHVFKVTTSMSLLELCDMSHPLLRRLAQDAPGTLNHAIQVATLAEAGAGAIAANGLLCRTAAYYHDIGKINKPEYFVENQGGGPNVHEKIRPAMSVLVIVGHVKDGVEMAREYALPPVLQHFIESHHGTTLVEYFYHAAQKQRGEGEALSELEFRYPGPKPRTKEAAIVLLADTVEGACRSMTEPTAARIGQLVSKLSRKRLMDGQFDACDMTLSELTRVEEAVTKTLCAIYHGRIAYPSDAQPQTERGPTGTEGA